MFKGIQVNSSSRRMTAVLFTILLLSACASLLNLPAGKPADVDEARQLWLVLEQEHMVGEHAELLKPFIGAARPHGWVLEVDSRVIQVGRHRGFVVVKKNYNGDTLSDKPTIAEVEKDRRRYLKAITIMFKREPGYDPDNQNWFWAKYHPDGRLFSMHKMGMTIAMAGRLMKGGTSPDRNRGCIYCHSSAGGGDYIFYPDIVPPAPAQP